MRKSRKKRWQEQQDEEFYQQYLRSEELRRENEEQLRQMNQNMNSFGSQPPDPFGPNFGNPGF